MEGGKSPLSNYDMQVLRIAERFGMSPDAVEEMSEDWFNKTLILIYGESERDKIK